MNERVRNLAVRMVAWGLAATGLLFVLFGLLGVRREANIALQLPYLASDGVGGLALIGVGAMLCIQQQMREQAARSAVSTAALEEWKEAALAEVRVFLQTTTLELEVRNPAPSHRRDNGNLPVPAVL
jgi:hypothetical protein